MTDQPGAEREIVLEAEYPHSIETVWAALTDPSKLAIWFRKNDFAPVLGRPFEFYYQPSPSGNWPGTLFGEILELVPHTRMVWSWSTPPALPVNTSVLTWTLTPTPAGTHVKLVQRGFPEEDQFKSQAAMTEGWAWHVEDLGTFLEGGHLEPQFDPNAGP